MSQYLTLLKVNIGGRHSVIFISYLAI